MSKYHVAFECVWSTIVDADSPEEAEDIAAEYCPCDIDGEGVVVEWMEGEEDE